MQVVPDTTGKEFFLPSTPDLDPFPLFDILEVVATRAGKGQASQANLTLTTTSGDVVLALTIPTNQTAHISLQNLGRGNGDGNTVEVSVHGHLSNGSDIITMIPLDDLGTAYLVSDLRVFDCAETSVIVFSTVVNTTVKVVYYSSSEAFNATAPTSQREYTLPNSPRQTAPATMLELLLLMVVVVGRTRVMSAAWLTPSTSATQAESTTAAPLQLQTVQARPFLQAAKPWAFPPTAPPRPQRRLQRRCRRSHL
ncbi:hypothetical protein C0Q70_04802 [Pomacea canaliculata]|uniref:Uncharacterized protein n=1 Tax=Pomacea canaliculata TaxID=400727 RepID=A0A2T7PJD5_POMCA|nr:hypothetical protein C0Q70_04802 [Pomacea canaliculata]